MVHFWFELMEALRFKRVRFYNDMLGVYLYELIHPETAESVPFYLDFLKKVASDQAKARKRAQNSIDAYADDLKSFLEYVYNAQNVFFDCDFETESTLLADIILSYPDYLTLGTNSPQKLASNTATVLNIKPVSSKTANRRLSTVNTFLDASAQFHSILKSLPDTSFLNVDRTSLDIHRDLNNCRKLAHSETKRLREKSVLAQVVSCGPKYAKSKAFKIKGDSSSQQLRNKYFPMEYLAPLFQAATTFRDRAIWALMAGGGLRISEVSQLLINDIDMVESIVHTYNYQDRIECFEGLTSSESSSLSFKGRKISEVTFIEPFKSIFFDSIAKYLEFERPMGLKHNYLFVTLGNNSRGKPLFTCSNSTLAYPLKKALTLIGCPLRSDDGDPYGPHSLRHFYGYWLVNFHVTAEGKGFSLLEVRDLMGHASESSTAIYAVIDHEISKEKMRKANLVITQVIDPIDSAPLDKLVDLKNSVIAAYRSGKY